MTEDSHILPRDFWIGLGVVTWGIVSLPIRGTWGFFRFAYEIIQGEGNAYRLGKRYWDDP